MKERQDDKQHLQHELNEALRNCLERMKVKINTEVDYDINLEQDYNELLEKFLNHLVMIAKTNKRLKW